MKTTRFARRLRCTSTLVVAIVSTALTAGCASAPVPAAKVARSQAVIRTAEELGAADDARAAVHLKLAKEQLVQAKVLMQSGDNESAGLVLLRAEADGETALNLARARLAEQDAKRAVDAAHRAMARMHGGDGS